MPTLDPLVGQIAAFAKSLSAQPVKFLRERADASVRIELTRDDTALSPAQKRLKLGDFHDELLAMTKEEGAINKAAIAQCLTTAVAGKNLRQLLVDYDKLSIDDVADGVTQAFALVQGILGLNTQQLQGKATALFDELDANPALKGFVSQSLQEVQASRASF
ncbi:MAG: hypothetical protein ACKVGZ_20670 [Alphaproteobacteria bacterium]